MFGAKVTLQNLQLSARHRIPPINHGTCGTKPHRPGEIPSSHWVTGDRGGSAAQVHEVCFGGATALQPGAASEIQNRMVEQNMIRLWRPCVHRLLDPETAPAPGVSPPLPEITPPRCQHQHAVTVLLLQTCRVSFSVVPSCTDSQFSKCTAAPVESAACCLVSSRQCLGDAEYMSNLGPVSVDLELKCSFSV